MPKRNTKNKSGHNVPGKPAPSHWVWFGENNQIISQSDLERINGQGNLNENPEAVSESANVDLAYEEEASTNATEVIEPNLSQEEASEGVSAQLNLTNHSPRNEFRSVDLTGDIDLMDWIVIGAQDC